ncbi:hypothetical protein NLG97_g2564 [Lecanicillium saksenae]|uniref:Uncharacterized protein n=1 Tax=Lecanicillium saksenae TaxID=468837 RepID=A0ACC1R184_9HYPO|nr:hypothetical protein NLG97_g2564 [Lecanicillium saksenae]
MSATINPRYLDLQNQQHAYRFSSQYPEPPGSSSHTVEDDRSPSLPSSLPGRYAPTAKGHAANRSLPRIDTEQLKSLSLRERNVARYRNHSPVVEMRRESFQKYRQLLWEKGRTQLGNRDAPHFNIAPVRLPTTPVSSYDSITIYTVVHSQGHSPIGLRRKFDRDMLTATVPQPLQTPSTPNFDRDELLSAITDTNKTLAAGRSKRGKKATSVKRNGRAKQQMASSIPQGLPIHFAYARSHLPLLAAILMSTQVRIGDTIELPVPHPEAWAETLAWVYIGEEELATDKVRENVEYLGGRMCSAEENSP